MKRNPRRVIRDGEEGGQGDSEPRGEGRPGTPDDGDAQEDPWQIDGFPDPRDPCGCAPPRPPAPPRSPREPNTPKADDGCGQILDLLRCIPNFDERCLRLRKPKTSPKFKIADLCGALPVKDRLAPMLMLVLRRYRDGVAPGNAFEAALHGFLGGLAPARLAALEAAQDGYEALPAARRDCVFETRFADWPDDRPLDPDFFARNLVGEFLAFGRDWRFAPNPPPPPGVGHARPWEQSFVVSGEPGKTTKATAPWPWICAISPVAQRGAVLEKDWFRNESQHVPGNRPRGSVEYMQHEFSWRCGSVSPSGTIGCDIEEPSVAGGAGFAECRGGPDYRVFNKEVAKQVCLVIPPINPGDEVGLRGLNFFSPDAHVHVRKVDGPPFRDIPPIALSDWQPDTTADPAAATCAEVRDHAFFIMPATVRDGAMDVPIPPGRYALSLIVPNDVGYASSEELRRWAAGGPPPRRKFVSNEVLFDLQPSPGLRYQILTDQAYCDEETDGPGSDEPWFVAYTATAEFAQAKTTVDLRFPSGPKEHPIRIMTADDVDTGEWISFTPATLFNDALGRRVVAIAVLGLEVDSEDAANEQIENFADAYFAYWEAFYTQLTAGAAAGVLGTAIEQAIEKGAAMSPLGWAAGAVIVVVLIGGLFYAAWAPADPIAFDVLTYTSRQLFDMTDSNRDVVPEPEWLRVHQLRMVSEPLGKTPVPGGNSEYAERRHYRSTHENSRYSLVYRFRRV